MHFNSLLVALCCTTTVSMGRKRAFSHEIRKKVWKPVRGDSLDACGFFSIYLKHNPCTIQGLCQNGYGKLASSWQKHWLCRTKVGVGTEWERDKQLPRWRQEVSGRMQCWSLVHMCKHLFIAWNMSILKQPSDNHEVLILFVNVTHFTRQHSWPARWLHWWRSLPASAVTWVPSPGSLWWKERTYSLQQVVLWPHRLCDHLLIHTHAHTKTNNAIKINNNW